MASISFAEGVNSSPTDIIAHLNQLDDAECGFVNPDTAIFTLGDFTYTVGFTGTGLIVDSLAITELGQEYATISAINLPTAEFLLALASEENASDNAALENIILGLNWKYIGNDNDDILSKDALSGDGVPLNFTGDDLIILNGGDDEFALGDGHDTGHGGTGADTLYGGAGDDTLYGNAGKDTLRGGAGRDLLVGGNGKDRLFGGEGWDIVSYEEEHEEGGTQGIVADLAAGTIIDTFGKTDTVNSIEDVWGSIFDDVIKGSSEDELLWGYDGDDRLVGKKGWDNLEGGLGDDTLKGGKGKDFLEGNEGNDILKGGSGFDVAFYDYDHNFGGTQGIDLDLNAGIATDTFGDTDTLSSIEGVSGSIFGDTISGSDKDEEFRGYDGNDTLRGKKGADILFGEDGDDDLFGGKGADELDGGFGDDILTGGKGADLFIFALGGGNDVITDFQVGIDEVFFDGDSDVTPTQEGDDVLLTAGDATMLILNASVEDFLPG